MTGHSCLIDHLLVYHFNNMQGWEELMLVVESSMAGGRKEVALAAIAVITTVMQAHGTTKAVSRRFVYRIVSFLHPVEDLNTILLLCF